MHKADHLETQDGADSVASDESYWEIDGIGNNNAQDLHAMMHCVLQGLVQMQEHGFMWDHYDPVAKQIIQTSITIFLFPLSKPTLKKPSFSVSMDNASAPSKFAASATFHYRKRTTTRPNTH